MKKDELNDIFKRSLAGKEDEIYTMHLGGGVYITINPKYPTMDIRHFWKPLDSDKPVATGKGAFSPSLFISNNNHLDRLSVTPFLVGIFFCSVSS
jgi:hypothetical protein